MTFDNFLSYGEPETCPAFFSGVERFKNFRKNFRRHTGAGIRKRDFYRCGENSISGKNIGTDGYDPPPRRSLDAVENEIEKHLTELFPVPAHRRQSRQT